MIYPILTSFFLLLGLLKALNTILIYQIKEYRFDRFRSKIKEEGIGTLMYPPNIQFPARSPRNILMTIIVIILLIPYGFLILSTHIITIAILGLCIIPYAILITSFAVCITTPYATYKRNSIIARAKEKITYTKPQIIAISGSYGKSSTKEFLAHILSNTYTVAKTDKNMNTDVGIAQSILNHVTSDTDIFIAEMGAYQKGENTTSCRITPPNYAIMTGLGNQHIDLFGSWDNIYLAETEPIKALSTNGIAYINADIEQYEKITHDYPVLIKGYSIHHSAHIHATNIQLSVDGSQATIHYQHTTFDIKTRLLGSHILQNILPCIACAIDMGIDQWRIISSIEQLSPVPHKLEVRSGIHQSTILDDSYNSCFEGFMAAIQTMNIFPHTNKIILSKGIIELGQEKRLTYQKLLQALQSTHIRLLTTDKTFIEENTMGAMITLYTYEYEIQEYLNTIADNTYLITIEGRFTPSFINHLIAQ